MKRIVILTAIVVALVGGVVWFGASNSSKTNTTQALTFVTVQQDITAGAKFYDVRTVDEYKAGHFAGALNWSLQHMQAGSMPDVAKDTKIFVYCHSGNRSGQATTLLRAAGYTNVIDLHGLANVEAIGGTLLTQ